MKKIQLLLLSLLLALPFNAYAQSNLYGDVNGDDEVTVADVNCVIDVILGGNGNHYAADVNNDGEITIADMNTVIGIILHSNQEGDWVDLGLPSGTIWATRNVGASAPEYYGDYFAWGETEPKSYYNWDTYKWYQSYNDANGNYHSGYTKYCTSSSYGLDGFVDNKTELDPSDDAACAHYPGGRMPSYDQIVELCNSCSWQWTQRNGVYGQLVTGPNGNTMFLPAAGYRWDDSLSDAGSDGYSWSRTLNSSGPRNAFSLYFGSGDWGWGYWISNYRYNGFTVRAVRVSQN